jgi:mannose-6-phosphate isomerase-like protein (cupin superfamily)
MRTLFVSALILTVPLLARDPLAKRIAHADPATYTQRDSVHAGAGPMRYATLIPGAAFTTNFFFVHRGELLPGGGIGHHFHNKMEEMFFILDGKAEFTIDNSTATLEGPAGAPCRLSHSHAIYNPTNQPVQWMNISITEREGKYDPMENLYGGTGTVMYRRTLQPEVFTTNWSFVDHLVLPPGTSMGRIRHPSVEKLFYVLNGSGTVTVDGESAPFKKDDAVAILLNDVHSLENNGTTDLELIIVGAATEKYMLDTVEVK